MSVSWYIAWRYLFSKKQNNFIHVISFLSVLGVALGSMALIVVLSVFNGLEALIHTIYGSFDPQIKITAVHGKAFAYTHDLKTALSGLDGVYAITEVIEDNSLVKYRNNQAVVKMKGVSNNFLKQYPLANYVEDGKPVLTDPSGYKYALIGRGVQYRLGIDLSSRFQELQFWYPKTGNNFTMNPDDAFNTGSLLPGGIFAIEKQYDDNYIFVPLQFAEAITHYQGKRTSLEVKLAEGASEALTIVRIRKLLGQDFHVRNHEEQHQSMLRAIRVERLFLYITFSIIMMVSSLNIFFSLTMLGMEKKRDILLLKSMGAMDYTVRNIFLWQGLAIAVVGAILGLSLGFALCYLQDTFGFVSMGADTALLNSYPVKMKVTDFVFTAIIILSSTLGISLQPALKAARS